MTTQAAAPSDDGGRTLICPACEQPNFVRAADLIDGGCLRCSGCGVESVLQRERIGHSGHIRWELIEAGDDDEP